MKLHRAPDKVEHKNSKLMQYSTFVASQWKHIETPHQGHPNMYTPVKNHNTQIYTNLVLTSWFFQYLHVEEYIYEISGEVIKVVVVAREIQP